MYKDLDKLQYNRAEAYEFLDKLGAKIWKILPLYEDNNEFLESYITVRILKHLVFGGGRLMSEDIKQKWFIEVSSGLGHALLILEKSKGLDTDSDKDKLYELHTELRNTIFAMTNLLNKVKNELVGGIDV